MSSYGDLWHDDVLDARNGWIVSPATCPAWPKMFSESGTRRMATEFAYTSSGNIETLSAAGGRPARVYSGRSGKRLAGPQMAKCCGSAKAVTSTKISSQGGAASMFARSPSLLFFWPAPPMALSLATAIARESMCFPPTENRAPPEWPRRCRVIEQALPRAASCYMFFVAGVLPPDVFDVASAPCDETWITKLNPADVVRRFSIHPEG